MSTGPARCSERVFDGSRLDFKGHMCTKPVKVEVGGKFFCSFHSPEAKAKRRAQEEKRWEDKKKGWERESLIRNLGNVCIAHGIISVEQLRSMLTANKQEVP